MKSRWTFLLDCLRQNVSYNVIDYDGRMGGGQQIVVTDMDGDGDLDVVSGGEAGLFLAENMTKSPKSAKSIQAESQ